MLINNKFWQNKPRIRYYLGHNRTRQPLQNWVNIVNDILRLRDYTLTVLNYTKIYEIVRNCTTFEPLICCYSQIKRWTWRGRPTRKVRRLHALERKMGILSGPIMAQMEKFKARLRYPLPLCHQSHIRRNNR